MAAKKVPYPVNQEEYFQRYIIRAFIDRHRAINKDYSEISDVYYATCDAEYTGDHGPYTVNLSSHGIKIISGASDYYSLDDILYSATTSILQDIHAMNFKFKPKIRVELISDLGVTQLGDYFPFADYPVTPILVSNFWYESLFEKLRKINHDHNRQRT